MTFENAFSNVVDSTSTSVSALKLSSWRGYIYRTDVPLATGITTEWSAGTHSVDDLVKVTTGSGSSATVQYYICKTATTASTEPTFDSSNWIELTNRAGLTMTYKEGNDDTGAGSLPGGQDHVTEYVATFSPYVNGSSVAYKCTSAPQGTYSGTTKYLEIDVQLQNALLSSDWTTGSATAFESARTGSGGRW